MVEAGIAVEANDVLNLKNEGFCTVDDNHRVSLSSAGRRLIESMGLTPKPMKRIKVTGNEASDLIDRILGELQ